MTPVIVSGTQASSSQIDLNSYAQTISECLKQTNGFWEVVYHNVCNGTVYSVPNGVMDWGWNFLGMGFFIGLGVMLLVFVIACSVGIWTSIRGE